MNKERAVRIAAGIDVGGTFTKVGIITASGSLLRQAELPTLPRQGPKRFIARLAQVLASWRADGLPYVTAGLAVAGDVDSARGTLRISPNLPGWEGFALRDELSRRLKMPVVMDNDANLAVWGAYLTELKDRPANVIGVTLGTGVGGGIIVAGQLYRGATGSAGEIGHARVEIAGELCHCGQRGCLEAYAGSYGIVRQARRLLEGDRKAGGILRRLAPDLERLEPAQISAAARSGDALSRKVLDATGRYLAIGLANAVMVLNPDAILILGGISRAGRWLFDPIARHFKAQPFKTAFGRVKLRIADNPNAGRIGAALLALEKA